MQVILLERVAKLGQMGEAVNVRPGFARNHLMPQGKAVRATMANRGRFETQRARLEARNLKRRDEARKVAETLDGKRFAIIRQAGDFGMLYGSVATRDIAVILTLNGFAVARSQVELNLPVKTLGMHDVEITLHPEVAVRVSINVARSAEEAERQDRGEDVTAREMFDLNDLGLEVGAFLETEGDPDLERG